MDHTFVEVNQSQRLYHVVKFHDVEDNSLGGLHCVPASWIKWQDEWTTVLVAYPDEPKEMTRKRVKNYQNPDEFWCSFLMEIIYSTNSYDDAIHYIDEGKHSAEEISSKVESPQCSISTNLSLTHGMNGCNWSEFEIWIHKQLNLDDPYSSTAKEVETITAQSNVLESKMDQNGHLDPFLTSAALRTSQDLGQSNILCRAAHTSHHTDEKWTLKHQEYSPGLAELMPNTGVFIEEAELANCLRSSRSSSSLARLLTKHIFTESVLRKCMYLGTHKGNRDYRLHPDAVSTIVDFVRTREYQRNSRLLNVKTIKHAMRSEMMKFKNNN